MTARALAGSPTGSFPVRRNSVRAAEGNYTYRPVIFRPGLVSYNPITLFQSAIYI
jgi:hypothetical protein